ncbi:MAG: NPCBM/NEW2 domain-containing protein [Clostridia bacterium]|nr:NPCBM/NEW2 domain-containing protein [Clostridia bacterium]
MKQGKKWTSFIAGMLTMALIFALGLPVLAAGSLTNLKDVLVGGIRIVIDGQELHPTDASGKTVSPMIYNGTTYLPVRAVASALGKAVYWDGPTYTVYLGDMDGKLEYPTVMLKDMTSIGHKFYNQTRLVDNYGNSYGSALYNGTGGIQTYEYLLNMKYSHFRGTLYIPEGVTSDRDAVITITADGKQIYASPVMTKTSYPVYFDVDVRGCNDLKIEIPSYAAHNHLRISLADAGFYQ